MKSIYFTLLISITALFLGCSKSSDDNQTKEPKAVDKTANLKSTGDSANDLLSNDNFNKIKVEIAYVDGFQPTQEAIDGFVSYLKERTFKEVVEVEYNRLESPGEESLTLDEIADLESENRTVYNDGETLAVYIYFADAPAEGDDEDEGLVTLGAVYRNTSMIIHEITVRKLADQSIFISDADVENTTLNHEFGHLFGLVNLGTTPVNDHEDIQLDDDGVPMLEDGEFVGNNHCSVDGCLMLAELQFGRPTNKGISSYAKSDKGLKAGCQLSGKSMLKMLEQFASKGSLAEPPGLDSECLLDLASNGGR